MVQLGPIALAADRLVAVALILVFVMVMDRIIIRAETKAETNAAVPRITAITLIAGIVAARLMYVIQHIDSFSRDGWSVLAIWQGGFSAWAGFVVAAALIAWRLRPVPAMLQGQVLLIVLAVSWFGTAEWLRPEPKPMPDLPSLVQLDGELFDTSDLIEGPYVINLWATWCPPCRRELPMLVEAAVDSPVPILLVNQAEAAETVERFLRNEGIKSDTILIDDAGTMLQRLGSGGLPVTLFVDGSGRIVTTHLGEISRAALFDNISQIERK